MTAAAGAAFDAVVLAGGGGRRLGGLDKAALAIGDRTLLDHVLDCCRQARHVVVVGPERPTSRPVTWTRESPTGTGPLAAIAAGLAAIAAPAAETVVVLATDLAYLTTAAVHLLVQERSLVQERGDGDAVLFEDAAGHRQPLCAAYDTLELSAAVIRLHPVDNVPVRDLLDQFPVTTIRDDHGASRDIDSTDDLARLRATRERREHEA